MAAKSLHVGLSGVRGGKLRGLRFHSVTGALRLLTESRLVTTANDEGAIDIYIDDKGNYRCLFMRYLCVLNETHLKTKSGVKAWLKIWLPKTIKYTGGK